MKQPNPKSLSTKATLLAASTFNVVAPAIIVSALPAIEKYFAEVPNAPLLARFVLTLPSLFIVIGSPIAGIIVDRWGRKFLLIASTALFALAGSSGFFLDSLPAILCGRSLLGLAIAGTAVSSTTLIGDYYTGATRAHFMGLQGGAMALAGVLFLMIGGYLTDLNWRLPFLSHLLALLLLPMMVMFISESCRSKSEFLEPNEQKTELGNLAPTPVRLLAFVYGTAFLSQIAFFVIAVQLPFHLKQLLNSSALEIAFSLALLNIVRIFVSIAYGKIKQRLAFISILSLIFALMGIGYGIIGFAGNYSLILLGSAITGMAVALVLPNFNLWVSAEVPDAIRGRALGWLTTLLSLGQFLSPICSQPLSQQVGLAMTFSGIGGLLGLLALTLVGMRQQVMAFIADKNFS